jgi:hypothetical protein
LIDETEGDREHGSVAVISGEGVHLHPFIVHMSLITNPMLTLCLPAASACRWTVDLLPLCVVLTLPIFPLLGTVSVAWWVDESSVVTMTGSASALPTRFAVSC